MLFSSYKFIHVNVMITMLVGGLWHGADLTFVAWGVVHGGCLVANHLWRGALSKTPTLHAARRRAPSRCAWLRPGGARFPSYWRHGCCSAPRPCTVR
ncbi:MAG TPA: MBOAT family O-acyltransferase [Xanthobacteraceae bacterium]|nr:MBOAT family O-acyltransferase [Xanthobacteraceae bacterium]